jgi:hypothetical protein
MHNLQLYDRIVRRSLDVVNTRFTTVQMQAAAIHNAWWKMRTRVVFCKTFFTNCEELNWISLSASAGRGVVA